MILEYSQLLSTAHRVLDGQQYVDDSSGRRIKRWKLNNSFAGDSLLYKATHINHPSAIWARESKANYQWLAYLLVELCKEYTHRYGKVHKCEEIGLVKWLVNCIPENIATKPFTQPTPAVGHFRFNTDLVQFEGYNGTNWGAVGGGATGGGNDEIFHENDQIVTTDYTIGTGSATSKNAGTFGPITVNSGVTVTVPSGSTWSIV